MRQGRTAGPSRRGHGWGGVYHFSAAGGPIFLGVPKFCVVEENFADCFKKNVDFFEKNVEVFGKKFGVF